MLLTCPGIRFDEAVAIDGHVGFASVAAINKADAHGLIAELVSLSMAYYTKLHDEGKATRTSSLRG
jgi:lysozyme family protein